MLENNIIFQVEMTGTVAKHPFKSFRRDDAQLTIWPTPSRSAVLIKGMS